MLGLEGLFKGRLFVKVENELWDDNSLEKEDLVVYAIIKRFYMPRVCGSRVSMDEIFSSLKLNNRNYYPIIRESLSRLQDKSIIGCYDDYFAPVSLDAVKPSIRLNIITKTLEDSFFVVYDDDMDRLIDASIDESINRIPLLRYYLSLCRVTNDNNLGSKHIGFLTHKQVNSYIGNRNTFAKYNEVMEKLNIFYYNNEYVSAKTGKNMATFFGECSSMSKSEFEMYVDDLAKFKGYVKLDKDSQSGRIKSGIKS